MNSCSTPEYCDCKKIIADAEKSDKDDVKQCLKVVAKPLNEFKELETDEDKTKFIEKLKKIEEACESKAREE